MPAVRRLLKHAKIEAAVLKRMCHRNQNEHEILKGDVCLVIRDPDGRAKNYCVECAMPVLDQARRDLDAFARGLGLSQPPPAGPSGGNRVVWDSTGAGLEP